MNRILRGAFYLSVFLLTHCISHAQNLTGIWQGYFIADDGEQYKLEFQVEHTKSMSITGVSYSYLDTRFYGKATMTGQFSKASKNFKIQEIKTVEVKNMGGGGTCIMNYNFTYIRSGKEEFLEGDFLGKREDRINPKNNGKWGDCGGGKVFLRRVMSSDFYVEPFLRDKPKPKAPAVNQSTNRNTASNKSPYTNKITDKSATKKNPATNKNTAKDNVVTKVTGKTEKGSIVTKNNSKPDSVKKLEVPAINQPVIIPDRRLPVNTPAILKTRENELMKTVYVSSNNITVKLYDNGEIDDDTISVYLDKRLVLSKKRLSASPLVVNLKMDDENNEHEMVMVAENLGRIPPNTSLMIVHCGDETFQVRITSTEQKNAVVRFVYRK